MSNSEPKIGRPKKDANSGGTQIAYSTTDEENRLIANMTSILNMLIRDGVQAKRNKLSNAVGTLNDYINNYANPRHDALTSNRDATSRGLKSKLNTAVKNARHRFASEVRDIRGYLEGIGFTNLEGKLYTDNEIEEIVKPINERVD